jgi:diguanylate cyclase (GGDEF)-like protein
MASTVHVTGPMAHIPAAAAVVTAAAVPLAGWTIHSVIWHRRRAADRRDPLTGAHRRDAFTAHATSLLRAYGDQVLIAFADIDDFKKLNDRRGHAAGDQILAATAARLTQWAGSRGVVGRLGGDEFAVATRIGPGRRQTRLDQLNRLLTQPVHVNDNTYWVAPAVSVGAAAPDLIGTRDLGLLLRAADAAMYAGKHTGTAVLAGPEHRDVPTINGRRAGRPGAGATEQVAA